MTLKKIPSMEHFITSRDGARQTRGLMAELMSSEKRKSQSARENHTRHLKEFEKEEHTSDVRLW
jgi:hypothetical protein